MLGKLYRIEIKKKKKDFIIKFFRIHFITGTHILLEEVTCRRSKVNQANCVHESVLRYKTKK